MIKLINYPYKDWKVGSIIDLGKKKNESMISMNRAIAIESVNKPTPSIIEEASVKKINSSEREGKKINKKKKYKNDSRTSNNNRPDKQEN